MVGVAIDARQLLRYRRLRQIATAEQDMRGVLDSADRRLIVAAPAARVGDVLAFIVALAALRVDLVVRTRQGARRHGAPDAKEVEPGNDDQQSPRRPPSSTPADAGRARGNSIRNERVGVPHGIWRAI